MKRILNLFVILSSLFCLSCEKTEKPEGEDGKTNTTPSVVRVGIMGDSISTFEGELVNDDYKFHYPCEVDEVSKVEQTWWWQLIYEKMENGVLDVNNSFSGTKVSQGTYAGLSGAKYAAGFVDRVGDFIDPDVIIIHGGTNDYLKDTDKENIGDYQWDTPLAQMDLTKFRSAYVYLVRKLQELYDGVQLILIVGDRIGALSDGKDLKYDDSIIEIAKHFDLPYVDLTPHRKVDIPVPDNCHPNYVGHAFIAQKVYDTCKDYLKASPNTGDNNDKAETLPEEFTVTVDFTKGWPFKEEPSKTFTAAGEEYTYSYKYDAEKESMDITFVITTRGKGSYSYVAPSGDADGYLAMPTEAASSNRFGCISIPPIIGRYPKKVELIRNKLGYFVAFGGFPDFNGHTASSNNPFQFPVTINDTVTWFPAGTASSTPRDYCIGIRFSGTKVNSIIITYSKAKP